MYTYMYTYILLHGLRQAGLRPDLAACSAELATTTNNKYDSTITVSISLVVVVVVVVLLLLLLQLLLLLLLFLIILLLLLLV